MAKIIDNPELAAELISQGEVVAIPTETVYGLAARGDDDNAVTQIFAIKERPQFNPLISHYCSLEAAQADVDINIKVVKLAKHCSPGPLTYILQTRSGCRISTLARANLSTAGIRIPSHALAMRVLESVNFPVVAPSANPSNRLSPVSAEHVDRLLGSKLKYILDGGRSQIGIESTIVDLSQAQTRILREGFITQELIASILEETIYSDMVSDIVAPGMLAKHYSPNYDLILNANPQTQAEALLAFGEAYPTFTKTKNLSPNHSLEEAAANLFSYLHEFEIEGIQSLAVMPIPSQGIGLAINDRLKRAANS